MTAAQDTVTREAWLRDCAEGLRPLFAQNGAEIPLYRISCSLPSRGAFAVRKRVIGQCHADENSADGRFEIMISHTVADDMEVAGVVAHELIHAAVGLAVGHKGPFKRLAHAIGLKGPMTSTEPGPDFIRFARPLLDRLGQYPHAKLSEGASGRKKQGTRLIKVACGRCGYTARTTAKWLDAVGAPHCPLHGQMEVAQ